MQDLSAEYENGAHIPDGAKFPARWAEQARRFRFGHRVSELDGFHVGTRRAIDIVTPPGIALGTMIFVHGGYWRAFDRSCWTHLAAGGLARGWRVALPGYDLCPDVSVRDISGQVAEAIAAVADAVDGPITLTGHSAGGHLVARMLAPGMIAEDVLPRVKRVAPISMLSDLRPLLCTDLNADLRLDEEEAAEESPLLQPAPSTEVALWVGAAERPAFLHQSRWLADAWQIRQHIVPLRHHFDVIDLLENKDSDLVRFLTLS